MRKPKYAIRDVVEHRVSANQTRIPSWKLPVRWSVQLIVHYIGDASEEFAYRCRGVAPDGHMTDSLVTLYEDELVPSQPFGEVTPTPERTDDDNPND